MVNYKPNKPAKNHPWRNALKSEVHNWAREKSDITRVHEVRVATPNSMISNRRGLAKTTKQV